MKWGPQINHLEKWSREKGDLLPALKNQPELFEDLAPILEAYDSLNGSRNICGTIPYSEIAAYAAANGIEDLQEFSRYINALERTLHNFREAERKAKEEQNKKGNRP